MSKRKKAIADSSGPVHAESSSSTQNLTHELIITVAGKEPVVRRALTSIRFEGEWNHVVTRQIAIEQTLVDGATLDDTLGGSKVRMFSQDVRDLYRQRCMNEAARSGHPVFKPSDLPVDEDTTLMEVGDALFEHSQR